MTHDLLIDLNYQANRTPVPQSRDELIANLARRWTQELLHGESCTEYKYCGATGYKATVKQIEDMPAFLRTIPQKSTKRG